MSRTALSKTKKLYLSAALAVMAVGGTWAYVATLPSHQVNTMVNAQHRLTQISYHGQKGRNALALLKTHAAVKTKHYSFGDLVTSINGVSGNGPKYWTFYVNGKEASVGAGAYVTKSSDTIMWKLQ